jgi:hypothetical protein
MTTLRKIFTIIVYIFAAIGFILTIVYAAVEFGWTKTSGIIDNQHDYFKNQVLNSKNETGQNKIDDASSTENASTTNEADSAIETNWIESPQWQTLKAAISKDEKSISQAAGVAGVPARLIVAPLVVEQLRLFYSDREIFKEVFAPLKILGNQSQFSWGVMGIKQDTAIEIENNLKDPQSSFYLGPQYEHLLDFSASSTASSTTALGTDPNEQRFDRLTDDTNRYYSYLYAGLMIRELEMQWQNAGFPIAERPDIIATLFNIGFENSHPNANPQVGGAEIDIGSTTYSFGGLAESFYASDEMTDIFPR